MIWRCFRLLGWSLALISSSLSLLIRSDLSIFTRNRVNFFRGFICIVFLVKAIASMFYLMIQAARLITWCNDFSRLNHCIIKIRDLNPQFSLLCLVARNLLFFLFHHRSLRASQIGQLGRILIKLLVSEHLFHLLIYHKGVFVVVILLHRCGDGNFEVPLFLRCFLGLRLFLCWCILSDRPLQNLSSLFFVHWQTLTILRW